MMTLDTVAFDIETTGFAVDDQLTVVGFDANVVLHLPQNGRSIMSVLKAEVYEEPNPGCDFHHGVGADPTE